MNSFGKHMGDYTENSSKMGWLVSILELGAWLGTLYSGFLAEIFSRKYAILVNTAIFIVGVVIQSTAVTGAGHNSILAGRFITGKSSCLLTIAYRKLTVAGMGVGSLSMIVPMYNAECAPPEIRGAMVGMQQMAITTGIMIAFWIDYGKFDQTSLAISPRSLFTRRRYQLHRRLRRRPIRCSMAGSVVPPALPCRHPWYRHDLHGNFTHEPDL
jgi:MFS family permease